MMHNIVIMLAQLISVLSLLSFWTQDRHYAWLVICKKLNMYVEYHNISLDTDDDVHRVSQHIFGYR